MKFNFKKVLTVAAMGLSAGLFFNSSLIFNSNMCVFAEDSLVSVINNAIGGLDVKDQNNLNKINENLFNYFSKIFSSGEQKLDFKKIQEELKESTLVYYHNFRNLKCDKEAKNVDIPKGIAKLDLKGINENIDVFGAVLTANASSNEEFKRLKELIDNNLDLKDNLKFRITDCGPSGERVIYEGKVILEDVKVHSEGSLRTDGLMLVTFGIIGKNSFKTNEKKDLKIDIFDVNAGKVIYSSRQVIEFKELSLKNLDKKPWLTPFSEN